MAEAEHGGNNPVRFEGLSQLVLADVLAALPMDQVRRMLQTGSPRLRAVGSLQWVGQRMTAVSATSIVQAALNVEAALCSDSVIRRLNGVVVIKEDKMRLGGYARGYLAILQRIPKTLHVKIVADLANKEQIIELLRCITPLEKLCYITYRGKWCTLSSFDLKYFPNLIYLHVFLDYHINVHQVMYRPSMMNGRDIIDLLRVMENPLNIEPDELERLREILDDGWLRSNGRNEAQGHAINGNKSSGYHAFDGWRCCTIKVNYDFWKFWGAESNCEYA